MHECAYPSLLDGGWRDLPFEYFRDGVEVHWLERGSGTAASVAILRYEPGSRIPRHRHAALETIVVLEGVQSDEKGDYPAGTVVLNRVGTVHSVWSEKGCVVLIEWELPVVILTEET